MTIISFLEQKNLKIHTINGLAVYRDSIVNHYNLGEEKSYQQLIDDIKQTLNIKAFYSCRNDDWLWISVIEKKNA